MKTITIQKISYNTFEINICCNKCSEVNERLISNISTIFPYSVKQIINSITLHNKYCHKCQTEYRAINLKHISIKDEDKILNSISYNIPQKNIYFKNKFITCKINIRENKCNTPIYIDSIRNKKGNKILNYCITNDYINFVFSGWIKTFLEVQNHLEYLLNCQDDNKSNNTNIQNSTNALPVLKQNTAKTPTIIKKADVLIISDIRRCANKNHTVKDVRAIIFTIINGHKQSQIIDTSFCFNCCRYTISESEFNRIKGKPICQIKWYDKKKNSLNNTDTWDFNIQHSILYKLGYNVQKQSGLTPNMRRQILVNAIKSHKLSKGQICSYLEMFIKQKSGQSNMKDAVAKWRSDLQYIRNFKVDTNETIEVKSLTKK